MSGRFVSGGTITSSGEVSKDAPPPTTAQPPPKNKEWEAVQQELEAERKRRDEARAKAATGEERSLYDVLQANKAAKQEAFEEASKIRNQFRALDDDEIEFLDEVRQKKVAEELRAKREIEDGLKAFREARKGETVIPSVGEVNAAEEWGAGRKRKRVKEREVKGVRRKGGEVEEKGKEKGEDEVKSSEVKREKEETVATPAVKTAPVVKKSLGLVAYGSDSDDDDD